jgi:hypothetical protein
MKKVFALLAAGLLAGSLVPGLASAERMYPQGNDSQINVYVNGTLLKLDQPALVKNDRTLVPFRAVLEALGAKVSWDEEKQTVHATKGDVEIELPLHVTTAKKNGQAVTLDVPAEQINYRTMVPLRFMAEALGAKLGWAGKSSSVFVSTYSQDSLVTLAQYMMDLDADLQEFTSLQQKSSTIYTDFIRNQTSYDEFKAAYSENLTAMENALAKLAAHPVPNESLSQHFAARNKELVQKALDTSVLRSRIITADGKPDTEALKQVLDLINELYSDNEAFEQEFLSSMDGK